MENGSGISPVAPASLFGLPEELVAFIASDLHLDLPSRISLALACRSLHFKITKYYKFYNGWDFVDECARLGYLGLLKFALENPRAAASLDVRVLEIAARHNRVQIASFIFPFVKDRIGDQEREWLCERAAYFGSRELLEQFWPKGVERRRSFAGSFY